MCSVNRFQCRSRTPSPTRATIQETLVTPSYLRQVPFDRWLSHINAIHVSRSRPTPGDLIVVECEAVATADHVREICFKKYARAIGPEKAEGKRPEDYVIKVGATTIVV